MVLEPKQTHIAYRCPHCGTAVLGYIGKFALSADMLKIKCPCGHSELTVTYSAERKVRLTVPCLFCENPHFFVLSETLFFEREIFMLACPYAGVDVCFVGRPDLLQRELDRTTAELNAMFEEMGVTLPGTASSADDVTSAQAEDGPLLADEQIYDILRFLVREIEAEGGIDCPCHGGAYDIDVVKDGVRVYCNECGAEHILHADSLSAAEAHLGCDSITLSPPSVPPPHIPS